MSLVSMAFSLFLLMDSIGNIPFFISILKDIPPLRQLRIIFRELLIALGVMILFHFLGDVFLNALHISEYAVSISGGVILFLLSLKMIFPSSEGALHKSSNDKEPFIVPLAVPLVAGPAVLATIMVYAKKEVGNSTTITAIILAWAASTVILLSSAFLQKILGQKGIIACERLMGLILTMISVEMLLKGVSDFIKINTGS